MYGIIAAVLVLLAMIIPYLVVIMVIVAAAIWSLVWKKIETSPPNPPWWLGFPLRRAKYSDLFNDTNILKIGPHWYALH